MKGDEMIALVFVTGVAHLLACSGLPVISVTTSCCCGMP